MGYMAKSPGHFKTEKAEAPVHEVAIRVRYTDIDRMGVAYYSRYLEWFEVGRTELFRQLGQPYKQMEEMGLYLPVVEAYCRYRRPARYDDVVVVTTFVEGPPRATLKLAHRVYRQDDGELLAEGYTILGFVDGEGKPIRPPRWFLEALKSWVAVS